MTRLYLVDGYNVILQDPELDDILDLEGLAGARRALRQEAEEYARAAGVRIRIIYDGAVDAMSHDDRYESAWVEDSFTSRDEKADERLVALALEYRRKGGLQIIVVSDDRDGIRNPLALAGYALLASAEFTRLLRSTAERRPPREKTLSERDRHELARVFLARDAIVRDRQAAEAAAAPPAPAPAAEPAASARRPTAPASTAPAKSPEKAGAATRAAGAAQQRQAEQRAAADAARDARKERGARKQARRLALLHSRRAGR